MPKLLQALTACTYSGKGVFASYGSELVEEYYAEWVPLESRYSIRMRIFLLPNASQVIINKAKYINCLAVYCTVFQMYPRSVNQIIGCVA